MAVRPFPIQVQASTGGDMTKPAVARLNSMQKLVLIVLPICPAVLMGESCKQLLCDCKITLQQTNIHFMPAAGFAALLLLSTAHKSCSTFKREQKAE